MPDHDAVHFHLRLADDKTVVVDAPSDALCAGVGSAFAEDPESRPAHVFGRIRRLVSGMVEIPGELGGPNEFTELIVNVVSFTAVPVREGSCAHIVDLQDKRWHATLRPRSKCVVNSGGAD